MWEIDIDREERKREGVREGGDKAQDEFDDVDIDFYDDFVIIDSRHKEIKPSYNQLKIVEEEKIKDCGSGQQLLIARAGLNEDEQKVTLEDFKIRKVIDKGSFGKVFLVVNKNNGKLYAMKRINKDILIDKKQI